MFSLMHLHTCATDKQGHEHAHTVTNMHKHVLAPGAVSPAFNPSRLVSGGVCVQGPCPLY